ncbi:hypothetical protein [Micromonospora sp. NPDC049645]|uniref:hypothetical protein n=1 Tax=Micromonospora sp. NPDC049645 TaxID=3155508 RepID=UPI003442E29A
MTNATAAQRVDQARRAYAVALGRRAEATRLAMDARDRLYAALRARYEEQLAELPDGPADPLTAGVPVPCRMCARAVPTDDPRHEFIAAHGELYARCQRSP